MKVEPRVTLSMGIASIWGDGANRPEDLMAIADHALYKAKEARRSRVCICAKAELLASE